MAQSEQEVLDVVVGVVLVGRLLSYQLYVRIPIVPRVIDRATRVKVITYLESFFKIVYSKSLGSLH